MTHYVIGDLQGCYGELQDLLTQLDFQHGRDTLWLVGDIVNRGANSLECLQFCMQHESSVQIVLGNHDLHLLAVLYGYGKIKRGDTLSPIINHSQAKKMRDWLRTQPLLVCNHAHVMVHAGILPQWSIAQAQQLAHEVSHELQHHPKTYFANMYGNKPTAWSPQLSGDDRLRLITNVFTRMRALTADNQLDYDFKSNLLEMPAHLCAWFDAPQRQHLDHTIVFGHWSALGYLARNQVIALDTGALWGGKLTAVNLSNHAITQVPSRHGLDWQKTLL